MWTANTVEEVLKQNKKMSLSDFPPPFPFDFITIPVEKVLQNPTFGTLKKTVSLPLKVFLIKNHV